jgi:hypothetical protein
MNATDFINTATSIAKAHADRVVNDALELADARVHTVEANARIAKLEAALQLFVKQWNACGPNSDFGRYFSNVRDAAKAALEVRS